jgi:bifunctional enzyme CysN/CysC
LSAIDNRADAHIGRLARVMTCGSVDDGKSTLLGRILFETGAVPADLLETLKKDSHKHSARTGELDFSLLFDGLEDERQQSITIDVGYRHFATANRSFIVADAPGHVQYTRNMATAASTADIAVILIDARKGMIEQTRRHAVICSTFSVPNIIVCVNKIDLVDFNEHIFRGIVDEFSKFSSRLSFNSVSALPTSAAYGDNVTSASARMAWYAGPSLLSLLETVTIGIERVAAPARLPVQWINRPYDGYRGLSGTIASGSLTLGDRIAVYPSGMEARVSGLENSISNVERVEAGQAVTVLLDADVDVVRGDMIAVPADGPSLTDEFLADLLWCSTEMLVPGRRYAAKFCGRNVIASVSELQSHLDIETLAASPARSLAINELGRCLIKLSTRVALDRYSANRTTGSFILIDRTSHDTVAAGIVIDPDPIRNLRWQSSFVSREARSLAKHQQPVALWFTGLPGAGKSTVADMVERKLHTLGHHTMMIDGDNIRQGINRDLGFSEEDRAENIRRAAEVAKLMVDAGLIVLCCFITPYGSDRQMARAIVGAEHFVEVFVDTPISECVRRDPKGLYARAKSGQLANLTGFNAPYEAPTRADLEIQTLQMSPETAAAAVLEYLVEHQYI